MPHQSYIKELKSLAIDSVHNKHQINRWLKMYEKEFYIAIEQTECRKWSKWVRDSNTHLFPCVCPLRVEDCIFIETYFELKLAVDLIEKDDYFKKLLKSYHLIKHNKNAVFEWVKANEDVGSNLFFTGKVEVKLSQELYDKLVISMDVAEFENLLAFNKIFNTNYYSKEFEKY